MSENNKKKRVLIVDDSGFVRKSLKNILEKLGCEVVGEAENGLTVLSRYKELKPDIVTIDMVMPHLSGINCLRLLKEIDPNVVAVMVTSVSSEETILDCIHEGVKSYILKPFDEEKIKEVMAKLGVTA
ncbi:MAG: response regulator [Nitrospirae bacterium]|nr:response regulator [Nitrospirota bacterium]